jgi:hypothetical protein
MKVSSSLLKAMLITATIGAATTSCRTVKPQTQEGEQYEVLPVENPSFFDKVKDLFRSGGGGEPCPACGMG